MTQTRSLSDLQAGRDLDALIAEKVLGWKWIKIAGLRLLVPPNFNNRGGISLMSRKDPYQFLPHFSTSIQIAWQVVEKFDFWDLTKTISGEYRAKLRRKVDGKVAGYVLGESTAPTAPLAICLAALAALEGGEG